MKQRLQAARMQLKICKSKPASGQSQLTSQPAGCPANPHMLSTCSLSKSPAQHSSRQLEVQELNTKHLITSGSRGSLGGRQPFKHQATSSADSERPTGSCDDPADGWYRVRPASSELGSEDCHDLNLTRFTDSADDVSAGKAASSQNESMCVVCMEHPSQVKFRPMRPHYHLQAMCIKGGSPAERVSDVPPPAAWVHSAASCEQ